MHLKQFEMILGTKQRNGFLVTRALDLAERMISRFKKMQK